MNEAAAELPFIHTVGDVLVQGGYTLGPRIIPDYELVYFPEATGTVYEPGGTPVALDEPCFVLTRPDESHLYRFDPDRHVRHLFVHFDYGPLRRSEPRYAALMARANRLPARSNSLAAGLMRQILRVANHPTAHWKGHMAMLLAAALEELQAYSERYLHSGTAQPLPLPVARAIEYMEEHLAEPITIEEIAGRSGWSHEHFTRIFVAATGRTPKRALLERRLLRAEGMMMRTEGTVKQIAYRVGFGDEHHFSKIYKRIRGITASEYMERCKDPLFRHTAAADDPETPYSVNCQVIVNAYIK